MASDMGLGSCMVPKEDGFPCGGQINEGEAIRTIMNNGPKVGHKRCADAYDARKGEAEMVKIAAQDGPGGPVDPSAGKDAIAGSTPLERTPGAPTPTLADVVLPEGVRPVSELPMREPVDTWEHTGPPGGRVIRDPSGESLIVVDSDPRPIHPISMPLKVSDIPLTPEEQEIIKEFRSGRLSARAKADPLRTEIDNRFTYHQPTNDQAQRYVVLREHARNYAHVILDQCPDSRERALALTHLDDVVMHANAAIARHS